MGAVGLMAGSSFFRNLKKNYQSYILLGVVIIAAGVLASLACFYIGLGSVQVPAEAAEAGVTEKQYMISMITGIMSGALTSTPALGALIKTAETDDVASSYAATYPIALICVVLGAQFMVLLFAG